MLQTYLHKNKIEAGCDEAGRGCLAGPVFAAAVILPINFKNNILNDSKKLSEKQRYELRTIIENEALHFAVAQIDNKEIDEINILKASIKAMHIALDHLQKEPEYILIDGNRFYKYKNIEHQCIVKGDGIYASIAAASILAKTYRDDFMQKINKEYPEYGWLQNKGYPTKKHRAAIEKYGFSPYHRLTFRCLPTNQISMEL